MKCPNKRLNSWKKLVEEYNEVGAMFIYSIEEDIPSIEKARELAAQYGLMSNQEIENNKIATEDEAFYSSVYSTLNDAEKLEIDALEAKLGVTSYDTIPEELMNKIKEVGAKNIRGKSLIEADQDRKTIQDPDSSFTDKLVATVRLELGFNEKITKNLLLRGTLEGNPSYDTAKKVKVIYDKLKQEQENPPAQKAPIKVISTSKSVKSSNFVLVKKALAKYNKKFNSIYFSDSEVLSLKSSIKNIILETFLNIESEELASGIVDKIEEITKGKFLNSVSAMITELNNYIQDSGVNKETNEYRKALQLHHLYSKIIEGYGSEKRIRISPKSQQTVTEEVDAWIQSALYKAKNALGYTEASKLDDLTEDGRIAGDVEQQESWILASLFRKIDAGLTTRLKAKLQLLNTYSYEGGKRIINTDLIGGTVYKDYSSTLLSLMDIFAAGKQGDNSFKKKMEILKEYLVLLESDEAYTEDYFIKHLVEQLEDENSINGYSAQEKALFNTVLNSDKNNMVTVAVKKGKSKLGTIYKLLVENRTYNSEFEIAIKDLISKLKDIISTDSEKVFYLSSLIRGRQGEIDPLYFKRSTIDFVLKALKQDDSYLNHLRESNLSKVDLSALVSYLNEINLKINHVNNKVKDVADSIFYAKALKEVQSKLIKNITGRVFSIFEELGMPMTKLSKDEFTKSLLLNEGIRLKTQESISAITKPLTKILSEAVEDLDKFGINERRENSKNLGTSFRTLVQHILSSSLQKTRAAVTRFKSKQVANYIAPKAITRKFQKLRTPGYIAKAAKDAYRSRSSVLRILSSNLKDNAHINWLDTIYSTLYTKGLIPSGMSDQSMRTEDTPLQYAFFTLGHYTGSTEMSYIDGKSGTTGVPYDTLKDEITKDGKKVVSHHVQVRPASFTTSGMAKDNAHIFTGLDFNAASIENGKVNVDDRHLNYYIDSVIVPELNRILRDLNSGKKINIDNYQGTLLYSIPELNNKYLLQEYLKKTGLKSISSLQELVDLQPEQEIYFNKVKEVITTSTRKYLQTNVDRYIEHLLRVGFITVDANNHYYLSKVAATVQDFKNLVVTQEEIDEIKESLGIYLFKDVKERVGTIERYFSLLEEFQRDLKENNIKNIGQLKFNADALDSALKTLLKLSNSIYNPEHEFAQKVKDILNFGITTTDVDDKFAVVEKVLESMKKDKLDLMSTVLKPRTNERSLGEKSKIVAAFLHKDKLETYDKDILALNGANEEILKSNKQALYDNSLSATRFRAFITNYIYSYSFNKANLDQLVYGDMAQYYKQNRKINSGKTFGESEDYNYVADVQATKDVAGKRYAKEIAPSTQSANTRTFIYLTVEDLEVPSEYYTEDNPYGVDPVTKVNLVDGAAISSMNARLDELEDEGYLNITSATRPIIKQWWNNEISDTEFQKKMNITNVLPYAAIVRKPVHAGEINEKVGPQEGEVNAQVYVKQGESVATKGVFGDNVNSMSGKLYRLIEQVEKQTGKSVRIVFPGSMKLGLTTNKISLKQLEYDEKSKEMVITIPGTKNKEKIDGKYYREVSEEGRGTQLRTDAKEDKKVGNSGQVNDIIISAITSKSSKRLQELKKEFLDIQSSIINTGLDYIKKAFQLDEIDLQSYIEKDSFSDEKLFEKITEVYTPKSIAAVIRQSLIAQSGVNKDLAIQTINSIDRSRLGWLELDKSGNFKYNITESVHFIDYMDILRNFIQKKTIKRKRSGFILPLMPSTFIDLSPSRTNGIILRNDIELSPTYKLKPAILTDKVPKFQILLPWDFEYFDEITGKMRKLEIENYLDSNGNLDSKKLPKSLFNSIAYRTPTQDYNMIVSFEVVGFIPKSMGNAVVAANELIQLTGWDFDIDKLYGVKNHLIKRKNGKLASIGKADLKNNPDLFVKAQENRKVEIMEEILSDKDILINNSLKALKGEDAFLTTYRGKKKSFADTLFGVLSSNKPFEGDSHLMPQYEETKRNNGANSSTAVSINAKLIRIYAQLKGAGVKLITRIEGVDTPVTLRLGKYSATEFGEEFRHPIFKPTKIEVPSNAKRDVKEAATMVESLDNVKNGISAILSVSLDDENLQLLYKLGLNSSSLQDLGAFFTIGSGFRIETILAMMSIPGINNNYTNKTKADVVSFILNQINLLNPDSEKIAEDDPTLDPENFSLLQDDNGPIDELSFAYTLLDLSKKLRTAIEFNNPEILTMEQYKDLYRLITFSKQVKSFYAGKNKYISPFQKLFNVDSKGLVRDVGNAYKLTNLIDSDLPRTKEMMKIRSLNAFSRVHKSYTSLINKLSNNKDVLQIKNWLDLSTKKLDSFNFFEIQEAYRTLKYRRKKPDIGSLFTRIDTILASENEELVEFRDSNVFLNNLTKKSFVNNKGESVNQLGVNKLGSNLVPNDYADGLESLRYAGIVGGIDMGILHRDLINYGLSTPTFIGISIRPYIDKKYYYPSIYSSNEKERAEQLKAETLDIIEVTKFLAYDNISEIVDKPSDKLYSMYKVLDQETGQWILYMKVQDTGNDAIDYERYFYEDYERFASESGIDSLRNLMETVDVTENINEDVTIIDSDKDTDDNLSTENIHALLERIFTTKNSIKFKQFLKAILPNNAKYVLGRANKWDGGANTLTINKESLFKDVQKIDEGTLSAKYHLKSQFKTKLVHELTHSSLMRVIDLWLSGTLLTSAMKVPSAFRQEIDKIVTNLNEAKIAVIKDLAKEITEGAKEHNQKYFSDKKIVRAVIENAFTPLLDSRNKSLREKVAASLGLPKETTGIDLVIALLQSKKYTTKNNTSKNKILSMNIGGTEVLSSQIEEDFKILLDAISDGYTKTVDKAEELYDILTETVTSDAEFGYIYGLINLHEFTSSSYEFGARVGGEENLPGYQERSEYKSIFSDNIVVKGFKKAFQLIKNLIDAIVGTDYANDMYRDIMYATILSKRLSFIEYTKDKRWVLKDESKDILTC